jgi:hypothetical protein
VRPVSLPNGRIPLREPPCPGRQVGAGVSPTLDAQHHLIAPFGNCNIVALVDVMPSRDVAIRSAAPQLSLDIRDQ